MVSSLLAAGLWPLLILVLAVVGVTAVALFRAEKQDVPAVFASFARAFGFHRSSEDPATPGPEDNYRADETDRPEEIV
jgi:hypothetical protein